MPDPVDKLSPPKYVYRLLAHREWPKAQKSGFIPYGDIDHRDGYLHLSMADQVVDTMKNYFAECRDMLALEIQYTDIEEDCRLEAVKTRGGALFPHYYGQLPIGYVRNVFPMEGNLSQGFCFGAKI